MTCGARNAGMVALGQPPWQTQGFAFARSPQPDLNEMLRSATPVLRRPAVEPVTQGTMSQPQLLRVRSAPGLGARAIPGGSCVQVPVPMGGSASQAGAAWRTSRSESFSTNGLVRSSSTGSFVPVNGMGKQQAAVVGRAPQTVLSSFAASADKRRTAAEFKNVLEKRESQIQALEICSSSQKSSPDKKAASLEQFTSKFPQNHISASLLAQLAAKDKEIAALRRQVFSNGYNHPGVEKQITPKSEPQDNGTNSEVGQSQDTEASTPVGDSPTSPVLVLEHEHSPTIFAPPQPSASAGVVITRLPLSSLKEEVTPRTDPSQHLSERAAQVEAEALELQELEVTRRVDLAVEVAPGRQRPSSLDCDSDASLMKAVAATAGGQFDETQPLPVHPRVVAVDGTCEGPLSRVSSTQFMEHIPLSRGGSGEAPSGRSSRVAEPRLGSKAALEMAAWALPLPGSWNNDRGGFCSGNSSLSNSVVCTPASLTRLPRRHRGPSSYILVRGEASPRCSTPGDSKLNTPRDADEEISQSPMRMTAVPSADPSVATTPSHEPARLPEADEHQGDPVSSEERVEERQQLLQQCQERLQEHQQRQRIEEGDSQSATATAMPQKLLAAVRVEHLPHEVSSCLEETHVVERIYPPRSSTPPPVADTETTLGRQASVQTLTAPVVDAIHDTAAAWAAAATADSPNGEGKTSGKGSGEAETAASTPPITHSASSEQLNELEALVARTTRERERVATCVRKQLEELEDIVMRATTGGASKPWHYQASSDSTAAPRPLVSRVYDPINGMAVVPMKFAYGSSVSSKAEAASPPSPVPVHVSVAAMPSPAQSLRGGAAVRVHGLTGHIAFNGRQGTCESFDQQLQRWNVKLECGTVIPFLLQNLHEVGVMGLPSRQVSQQSQLSPTSPLRPLGVYSVAMQQTSSPAPARWLGSPGISVAVATAGGHARSLSPTQDRRSFVAPAPSHVRRQHSEPRLIQPWGARAADASRGAPAITPAPMNGCRGQTGYSALSPMMPLMSQYGVPVSRSSSNSALRSATPPPQRAAVRSVSPWKPAAVQSVSPWEPAAVQALQAQLASPSKVHFQFQPQQHAPQQQQQQAQQQLHQQPPQQPSQQQLQQPSQQMSQQPSIQANEVSAPGWTKRSLSPVRGARQPSQAAQRPSSDALVLLPQGKISL